MTTSAFWTRDKTIELIEMLESYPELWDNTHKTYRDRIKKQAATMNMATHFSVTFAEITRKLHNLRTQMNNEMRKIKKKKSGDGVDDVVFTSNWEFFNSLKFLIGGATCSDTQSNLVSMIIYFTSFQIFLYYYLLNVTRKHFKFKYIRQKNI